VKWFSTEHAMNQTINKMLILGDDIFRGCCLYSIFRLSLLLNPGYLGVVLLQILCLFFVGRDANLHGLPLDDAWIHQVIARNIAEQGAFGFIPEKFASGATSFLWPIILSIHFVAGGTTPALFALLINAAFYFGIGYFVWKILLQSQLSSRDAMFCTMAFVSSGNFVWFAFCGMETMMLVFLVCATIYYWQHDRSNRGAVLSALFSIGLICTRLDAAILTGIIILYEIFDRERGSVKRILIYTGVSSIGLTALLMMNWVKSGQIFPGTMEARRWLWQLGDQEVSTFDQIETLLTQWIGRLEEFTFQANFLYSNFILIATVLVGAWILWAGRNHAVRQLLLFGCGHLAVFAVLFPIEGHGGRYQPITPALFSLALCLGAMTVCGAVSFLLTKRELVRSWGSGLTSVVILMLLLRGGWQWGDYHAKAVFHIDNTEVAMGKYLSYLPPTARIASFDIGGSGFFGQRELFDMGGLIDSSVMRALKDGNIYEWIQKKEITHVVVPVAYDDYSLEAWNYLQILRLENHVKDGSLRRIYSLETSPEIWTSGFRATLNAAPRQIVYKVVN
jgi:hypothetical protein